MILTVTLLNGQGLGMLIGVFAKAKQAGGLVALARVPMGRAREVIIVTDLIHLFKIFDTVDEAVEYLLGLMKSGTS